MGVVVVLVVASAGCSAGEAEPSALPPVGSGSAPRVHASTAPTSQATPTAGAGLAPSTEPADVERALPSEASAFTRYFFGVVNDAYVLRQVEHVERLASPECGSCAAVIADIRRLMTQDHRVAGRRYIVASAAAAPALGDGRVIVDFRFTTDPYVERDTDNAVVKEFPAQPARDGQVMLERNKDLWRVDAIRLLDS